jgi:hypothetical protein
VRYEGGGGEFGTPGKNTEIHRWISLVDLKDSGNFEKAQKKVILRIILKAYEIMAWIRFILLCRRISPRGFFF